MNLYYTTKAIACELQNSHWYCKIQNITCKYKFAPYDMLKNFNSTVQGHTKQLFIFYFLFFKVIMLIIWYFNNKTNLHICEIPFTNNKLQFNLN